MIGRTKQQHSNDDTRTEGKRNKRTRFRVVDADQLNAESVYATNQIELRRPSNK